MARINKFIGFLSVSLNTLIYVVWIYLFYNLSAHEERVSAFRSIFLGLGAQALTISAIVLTIWSFRYFFFEPDNLPKKIIGIMQIVFLLLLIFQLL